VLHLLTSPDVRGSVIGWETFPALLTALTQNTTLVLPSVYTVRLLVLVTTMSEVGVGNRVSYQEMLSQCRV